MPQSVRFYDLVTKEHFTTDDWKSSRDKRGKMRAMTMRTTKAGKKYACYAYLSSEEK